jgi:ADP-ribose pyrophosphatase YjhB (NUDIX family)
MEQNDLTFTTNEGKFNFRVGAIIISDNRLLMVKNESLPYYYSVGGRVKLNETTVEAVVRETFEETGIMFEIDKLAFVHENFFQEEITGEYFHEIAFFYFMKVPSNMMLVCNSYGEQGGKENLEWLPLSDIESYYLFPDFFKTKISNDINEIDHIISRR